MKEIKNNIVLSNNQLIDISKLKDLQFSSQISNDIREALLKV
jgi:hypothetical protein